MELLDLMKHFYLSKCCGKEVCVVHGNEGTSYFLCKKCHKPCDVKEGK